MEKGIVYILEYVGFYKIGYTRQSLKKRLTAYQFPTKPRIVAEYHVHNPKKAEKDMHRVSSKYRVRNEWFKFDADSDVISLADTVLEGYLLSSEDLYNIKYVIKNKKLIEYRCLDTNNTIHIPPNSPHIVRGLSNVVDTYITEDNYIPVMWNNSNFIHAMRYILCSVYMVDVTDFKIMSSMSEKEILRPRGLHEIFTFDGVYDGWDDTRFRNIADDYLSDLKYPEDNIPTKIPDTLSDYQKSLVEGALETDKDRFWIAYNNAKSGNRKDWGVLKDIYRSNKIYKRWFRSTHYGD